MTCAFTLELPGEPAVYYADVRRVVEDNGGSVEGNEMQGTITGPTPVGPMAANYFALDRALRIEVTEKPLLVPCSAIEAKMRELVSHLSPLGFEAPEPPMEGKVTVIPTTVIEGEVPRDTRASKRGLFVPLVLAAGVAGGAVWVLSRPRRRRHRRRPA